MSSIITIDDVRQFSQDRTADDNQLLSGLAFSDDEIRAAMRFAAREYNSIPPIGGSITADDLPGDTNMFLDAIMWGLYIGAISRMARNQIEYTAGNATVNLEKTQIAYMRELAKIHADRFQQAARTWKLSCNLSQFFGIHDTIHGAGFGV